MSFKSFIRSILPPTTRCFEEHSDRIETRSGSIGTKTDALLAEVRGLREANVRTADQLAEFAEAINARPSSCDAIVRALESAVAKPTAST